MGCMGGLSVCVRNHVYIHVPGELTTIFPSLYSEHEFEAVSSRVFVARKSSQVAKQSISEVTVT